ncbi:MAG TPA: hypothetical protein VFY85_11570 [Gemmatimonadaceae bacterium]|nr:hypothetical protein [Gemmatimonadaceae bacterium]
MTLYHYTCAHGCQAIGETGVLVPIRRLAPPESLASLTEHRVPPWMADLIWLTDLDFPMRAALGLTSYTLGCDRTSYRYRVLDESTARPWLKVRRELVGGLDLELADGAMPRHWWVSWAPVPVEYDPAEVMAS